MWGWFLALVVALALLAAAVAFWVRVAPVEPDRWHVGPLSEGRPNGNGWLVAPDGDAEPPRVEGNVTEVLAQLDRVARAEPRTRRIAGSVEEGRITYESRSRIWRFPDYTTVTVVEEDRAVVPVLLARARFGRSDLGVNRKRVERWLGPLG